MDIIDLEEALERVQDDRELLKELMEDFVKDYLSKRKILNKAIEQKNFELIKDTAHFIKGAAGNISAKTIYTCLVIVEQLADNQQIDLVVELLIDVDKQFAELQAYVSRFKIK